MYTKDMRVEGFDSKLHAAMQAELVRQEEHIELIASENMTSPRVLECQGSVLTNKYAEGYPGKRYYGGCEHVDVVETLAIERACELFGADWANVQPHSGSQANGAVYHALLNPGDTLMGMSLADGGHLTHGAKVNVSGRIYNSIQYGLDIKTGELDYPEIERLAKEHKPKLLITGFSAYSRIVDWQRLRDIADSVNALMLADIAHVAGLIAVGEYPSPVHIADVTTTTTHKTLRGPRSGLIMGKANPDIQKKINFMVFPAYQGGPHMHTIAAKAVSFMEAMQPTFKDYIRQVKENARVMAATFIERGLKIVSGGTDNHLFLVDMIDKGLTGKAVDAAIGRANITANKNAVPNDPQSPFVTSGIRIGTPSVTTRGFNAGDCRNVANWICDIMLSMEGNEANETIIAQVKENVLALCKSKPLYEN
ncbi:MAG: serine hydroxymethyltransferase [Candidatus Eutrophobiaceae bacterium]